jgi:hypothetical protein
MSLRHVHGLLVLGALACSGCTTMLTSMNNARVLEPAEVQATANLQGTVHSGSIDGLVGGVEAIGERFGESSDAPIEEEEFRGWLDSVLLITLFAPGAGPEFGARVGVTDAVLEGIDVGVRSDFGVVRGDAKLGLWSDEAAGQAVSASLAYTHHLGVAPGLVEYVTLSSFSRGDVELQLLWDVASSDFFRVTLSPRVIVGRISVESTIPEDILARLPESITQFDPSNLFRDEWIVHYGANATLMAGYKYVWLAFDLGLFGTSFNPEVLGSERDYGGGALSLGLGLSGNYAF